MKKQKCVFGKQRGVECEGRGAQSICEAGGDESGRDEDQRVEARIVGQSYEFAGSVGGGAGTFPGSEGRDREGAFRSETQQTDGGGDFL